MNGKVALVTGGTSGIGRATAVAFAERGAKVVITGRREEEGLKTTKLVEETGAQALFVRADASSEADCKQMVSAAVSKFGRLDFAFNNAGIEGEMVPVAEQTLENFRRVMDINVLGVMMSMKYEIPAIVEAGGGAIVNTSSIASTISMPGMGVYSASKHAVIGLTKAAALEMASSKIRINAVSPAAVRTEMYDRFTGGDKATQDQLGAMHPIGRSATSEEIASVVTFLCSDAASFVTGANYMIDGGFTVQ